MEEAQALLLRNFRVGKDNNSECAKWLTEMAKDMLAPIPFREVFVILALFLPQLTFLEGTRAQQNLWASPVAAVFASASSRPTGRISYLFSFLFEFNQGDLCLSAHITPVPVQKKHDPLVG